MHDPVSAPPPSDPRSLPAPREARVSDAAGIARLSGELGYPIGEDEMTERLRRLLPLDSQFVAVVEDADGRLLGWIGAERRFLLESGERMEIVGLVVGSEARRRGIGASLVGAAERWAVAQGQPSVLVRSNVTRLESHPFYESLGYSRRKTQHAYAKAL
jgi:GNAT superfamily N-acetyltransferase